jgi:hypothetical protein
MTTKRIFNYKVDIISVAYLGQYYTQIYVENEESELIWNC